MTAVTQPAFESVGSPLAQFVSDGWIATRRNLIKIKRVPEILVFTILQPIMFVLLFSQVYAGAMNVPDYVNFLMAGIFAQTVIFGSTFSGAAMAQDLKDGIIDRFRTLPMSPAAVLIGRTNGDLVINSISMLIMMGTGWVVGWRVTTSFWGFLGGVGVLLLFSYSFSWVMALLGMSVRSPEVINNASFMILFPLTFISNAFVPIHNTNPEFPEPTAWTLQNPIVTVIIGIVVMLVIFVPLAVRKFASVSSR
ncbi:ABC-2 type transport system permease protein [Arthrobacter subterraneus]|uniref:ABC-2 type transport system permease protein n=1 Tax=Arthrobacter subterraneus TaxID=335973 RepID=A0A1G8LBI8_9MICC|nr:ABC transporter permease [Arthrobacter subterraneus]SDI53088.1 ABC-2 type transport system permease protein [Arthrobacter subterraneus]